MVLDYTVDGASFVPGKPRLWSDRQLPFPGTTNLDLAPDGRHFAVLTLPDAAHADQGAVVFLAELLRRAEAEDSVTPQQNIAHYRMTGNLRGGMGCCGRP